MEGPGRGVIIPCAYRGEAGSGFGRSIRIDNQTTAVKAAAAQRFCSYLTAGYIWNICQLFAICVFLPCSDAHGEPCPGKRSAESIPEKNL